MLTPETPLILGSRSPRRSELLCKILVPYEVFAVDVNEAVQGDELPEEYVRRVAQLKLTMVCQALSAQGRIFPGVLVADTSVTCGGRILGKPKDSAEAVSMLSMLCGRTHEVHTSYGLYGSKTQKSIFRTVTTSVTLRSATHNELTRYAATGEGLDKAGAYAIQGCGAFLVERIEGSYSNVVGLPLCELVLDLRSLGLLTAYP